MLTKSLLKIVRLVLGIFGISIIKSSTAAKYHEASQNSLRFELIQVLSNKENSYQLLKLQEISRSQLGQDLFVMSRLNFKKNGYFVEFGAANGIVDSNTFSLEKEYGWAGILAEPAEIWQDDLRANRNCNIETKCLHQTSNLTVPFFEAKDHGLSGLTSMLSIDRYKTQRKKGRAYDVETISLTDLFLKHNAPNHIDYLSIDTEGSEYLILKNFDFNKYSFGVITCEHNFSETREQVNLLLTSKGYVRKHEAISVFDDWYVNPTFVSS